MNGRTVSTIGSHPNEGKCRAKPDVRCVPLVPASGGKWKATMRTRLRTAYADPCLSKLAGLYTTSVSHDDVSYPDPRPFLTSQFAWPKLYPWTETRPRLKCCPCWTTC